MSIGISIVGSSATLGINLVINCKHFQSVSTAHVACLLERAHKVFKCGIGSESRLRILVYKLPNEVAC